MIIGIDAGGTKTHAVLSIDNRIVDECITGSGNIRNNYEQAYISITDAIHQLLIKYPNSPCEIKLGVAGFSHIENRVRLQNELSFKYSQVKITTDAHIACLAAHQGRDGAILICGTGVVGYINSKSSQLQLGGFGFPHGDLGGGAYLGLEISKLLCKAMDKIIPMSPMLDDVYKDFNYDYNQAKLWLINAKVADYAKFAKALLPYLNGGDQNAQIIIKNATNEIKEFLTAMYKYNLPVKLYGGLSEIYLPLLSSDFPELIISKVNAAYGAVYL